MTDIPLVEKYSRSMVEQFLRSANLKFMIDQDGDYQVTFAEDDSYGDAVIVWFISAGEQKEILAIRAHSNRVVPEPEWPRFMALCNTWNADKRWPKVYLATNIGREKGGRLVAEQQFDLEKGIHYDLLAYLCRQSIAVSFQFFEWILKQAGA